MKTLKDLAVKHSYHCSSNNYYSNNAGWTFPTMADFLDEFESADIDMNMVFRWDVNPATEYDDNDNKIESGFYEAEIFIMHQRKGKFSPYIVERFDEEDVPRFLLYIQRHWEYMKKLWNPISSC